MSAKTKRCQPSTQTRNSYNSPQAAMCRERLKPRPLSYSSQDLSPVARWKAVVAGEGGGGHGRGNCILINVGRAVDNTRGNGSKKEADWRCIRNDEWKIRSFHPKSHFPSRKKKMKKKAYYLEVDEDLPDSEDYWLAKNQAQYYERKSCGLVAPQIKKVKRQITGNRNAKLGGGKKKEKVT